MKNLGLAMLDGYVYAVGGWEGSSRLDSVERYDPETNSWASVANLKMAVTSPAVVAHGGKFRGRGGPRPIRYFFILPTGELKAAGESIGFKSTYKIIKESVL